MGLLARLAKVRTAAELERASELRFWDGLVLALGQEARPAGAIYLMGYVVECLLMLGYCRAKAARDDVDIHRDLLSRDYTRHYQRLYGKLKRNDHELAFLLFAFERERAARGQPLDAAFLGALTENVNRISSHWTESLRYRDVRPDPRELWEMVECVEWVFENRLKFMEVTHAGPPT